MATVTGIAPGAATAGGEGFALVVTGTGFASGDTVRLDGQSRGTEFVSATTLRAIVLASDLLVARVLSVDVQTGESGLLATAPLVVLGAIPVAPAAPPWLPALVTTTGRILAEDGRRFITEDSRALRLED